MRPDQDAEFVADVEAVSLPMPTHTTRKNPRFCTDEQHAQLFGGGQRKSHCPPPKSMAIE